MRAKKSLGQNFLRDADIVRRIVDSLSPADDETIIEIGPGQGALTAEILGRGSRVIAIEFDRDLIAPLRSRFFDRARLTVINDDALSVDFGAVIGDVSPVKLVANLPYNISTPILQQMIQHREVFSQLVLMFQREVAQRIAAPPGSSDRGYLSVLVQNAFSTESLFDVPKTAFFPVPAVWSTVLRLTPQTPEVTDDAAFRSLLKCAFAQKRKTLNNNLKAAGMVKPAETLAASEIEGNRRAETLTLAEWRRLAESVNRYA